jgi:uncharacterized protein YbjT (DUF2867 family)
MRIFVTGATGVLGSRAVRLQRGRGRADAPAGWTPRYRAALDGFGAIIVGE